MIIEVRDVKKSFGALPVLQGVTFSVEKGRGH
jgi:ABC-type sugar transport system ATPase subunit